MNTNDKNVSEKHELRPYKYSYPRILVLSKLIDNLLAVNIYFLL